MDMTNPIYKELLKKLTTANIKLPQVNRIQINTMSNDEKELNEYLES